LSKSWKDIFHIQGSSQKASEAGSVAKNLANYKNSEKYGSVEKIILLL